MLEDIVTSQSFVLCTHVLHALKLRLNGPDFND